MTTVAGAFPIQGVGKLPNVTIQHPGEVWSNRRASGNVVPGAAVAPVIGAKLKYKQLVAGDTPDSRQVAVALRQIQVPDQNTGPAALGPNELVNQMIADQDWLRTYHTGVLGLTLCEPRADYQAGQLVGWAPAAARAAGKAAGTGAWSNAGILAGTDIFEVMEFRPYGGGNEGLLTVRFLRGDE
jgi:hypothetical protein